MLDVALRRAEEIARAKPQRRAWIHDTRKATDPEVERRAWEVPAALADVLPGGLRHGSSLSVSGSLSLLLAVLGGPSSDGAWCALVGMPPISAEAAEEYGVDLSRLPVVDVSGARWVTMVGVLLDTVDVVVARPPARLTAGDAQRLAARMRSRSSVLVAYLDDPSASWPSADLCLTARGGQWHGADAGSGRLVSRSMTILASGRGRASRPAAADLHLPATGGGLISTDLLKDVAVTELLPLSRAG